MSKREEALEDLLVLRIGMKRILNEATPSEIRILKMYGFYTLAQGVLSRLECPINYISSDKPQTAPPVRKESIYTRSRYPATTPVTNH